MKRQCWICFSEEESSSSADAWVSPCKCKGTTQWVHQTCLQDWISHTSAADDPTSSLVTPSISCPQCHFQYRIKESYVVPRPVLYIIQEVERWKNRLVIVSAVGALSTCLWFVAFSYGCTILYIVVGPDEAHSFYSHYGSPLIRLGQTLLFNQSLSEPSSFSTLFKIWLKLMLGMPLIPLSILSNRIGFGPGVLGMTLPVVLFDGPGSLALSFPPTSNVTALLLPVAYNGYRSLRQRLFSKFFKEQNGVEDISMEEFAFDGDLDPAADERAARMIVRVSAESITSLLLAPVASAILGWALFRRTSLVPFHRACIGGAIILLVRDIGTMVAQLQAERRKTSRRVLNYN